MLPFTRLYRLGLRLYPASFRAAFGDEMAAVFAEHLAEAEGNNPAAAWGLLARELGGLVSQAAHERVAEMRPRPGQVWQTTHRVGVVVADQARRLTKLLVAGLIVALLAIPFCLIAFQLAWQYDENTPSVNDVALADLNGDGHLDAFLAVGHGNMPFPAYALYNDGAGRLGGQARAIGKWVGASVALGDLNGDGRVDALLDITAGGIVFYLNEPETFHEYDYLAAPGPKGVMRLRPVLGDLNGDGRLDVFAAGCCGREGGEWLANRQLPLQLPYSQAWLHVQGNLLRAGPQLGALGSNAAALADLNGDGSLDVFLANGHTLQADGQVQTNTPDTVWFNDGQGNFADSGQQLGQAESTAVTLGDLNGDGLADAVVGNNGPDEVWVNDGQGFFTDSGQRLGTGLTEYVFLADLDGDGDLDLIAAGATQARPWFNDGHGQFQAGSQRLRYSTNAAVTVGDLDGDGWADVLVAGAQTSQTWVNDGAGRFRASAIVRYK